MKTAKDFQDGHIWFSVINRPPRSTFTRVQRVSCCFSLLLCTMLTSIMFWGIPTDPSEQTMDLGRKPKRENKWRKPSSGNYCSSLCIQSVLVFLKRSKRPRHCPSLVKPRHCTIDSVDVWRTHTFLNPANPQFSLQVILSSPGSRSWSEFKAPSSCSPSICSLWVSSETPVPGKMLPKQTHPIRQRKVKFPRQSPPPQRKSQKTSHWTPWWKLVFKISDLKVIIHSFSSVIVVFLYQDIKRIAQSLLKAMKSPVPDMELRPGQQVDINTLLSLLEDIIRLQNWAAGDFYTDEIKKDHSKTVSLHSVNLQGSQDEVLDIWLVSYKLHSSLTGQIISLYWLLLIN